MASENRRPLKVFLCHASGDKPPVRDLYKHLVAEGVDAWLDKEKLLPGQDWRLEIPKAVKAADVVVVCLSNKSVTKEGYVQKEIKFALDSAEEKPEGTIFLIPARLEDCTVPDRLSRWQWVDLYEENGFIQLLRSLKLRADAVGAAVEPASYVDSDKETERRLEQLYTEGLAAFYTEDWDRACQRFRTILSERPNHKNATEKLAEAERQRNLSRLYAQSSEAVRSEDWGNAIKTLEELSQKSADYKDAAQLLRDAKKQKRLMELYAEARALHLAQKWQAVVKVFEQIAAIEPDYSDPDGLLSSAEKEVVELQRLAGLNTQYSHALHEMESGNWYEARRLLEAVHKSQTGFLETEKLLRKVENEISKEEEKHKQSDQINTLYEQAHGLLRSKKWRNALDKMEEIRKLDDGFPDTDGIAEQAQKELAREEQEAERQNKLAALYAEAVRLLKEEKYQEALDKWGEVRAVDLKYPDRQRVHNAARKALSKQVKPISTKPRFVMPKSLWIGLGGIGAIAVLIFAINQFGNDENKASLVPTIAPKDVVENTAPPVPTPISVPSKTSIPKTIGQIPISCTGSHPGDELNIVHGWSGQDEDRFYSILQPLMEECGLILKPEFISDAETRDQRIQADTLPDVVFGQVNEIYRHQDRLFAMDQLGASPDVYITSAIEPGIINDKWLGLPVNYNIKTIIWYSPSKFRESGYSIPVTWSELEALVDKMAADNKIPWSMGFESGGASGWPGSDFVQDILLVQQGPEYVRGIINGTIPYNDPGVIQAYQTYGKWAKDPKYTVGGASGTISTNFFDAIYQPFSTPPESMMVKQASFTNSIIQTRFPDMRFGTDYDNFMVPGVKGLQTYFNWMMAFNDKPAVRALVTYLASPQGGINWAKSGLDLSPNKNATGNYADPLLAKENEIALNVQEYTLDLGDTIGGNFQYAEFEAFVNYLNGRSLDNILSNLVTLQKEALR